MDEGRAARHRGRWRKPRLSRLLLFFIPLVLVLAGSVVLDPQLAQLDPSHGLWGLTQPWGNQTFTLQGLHGPVTIVRDGAGTVHIYAQDDQDLMFAQGFAQASDRLFQMEIESAAAQGNVSQFVGQAGVASDIAYRTLGLPQAALEMQADVWTVSPTLAQDLQSFSAGVNAYIAWAEAHNRLPIYFTGLGVKPYTWTPAACFAFQELMTWGQTTGIVEPLLAALSAIHMGDNATNELFSIYPPYWQNFTVLPGDGTINGQNLTQQGIQPSYVFSQDWLGSWATGIPASEESQLAPLYQAALGAISDPYVPAPRVDEGAGSNSWVVAASHSADHLPMLANDPHLPISLPSLWVPTELVDPNYQVSGYALAGLPGILIGHDSHVAWALTNSEGATALDYVETLQGDQYLSNGKWYPIHTIYENWTVAASSSNPSYVKRFTLNETDHGPMLAQVGNHGLAIDWAADGPTWEALAELEFDRAVSVDQFISILHQWWTVPNLNVLLAENNATAGTTHIGWVIPCHYPLVNETMPNGQHVTVIGSRAPLNGSGGFESVGTIPWADAPMSIDPAQGYLYAPNQPTVGQNFPYPLIGGWWDSGGRGHAVGTFLAEHPTMTVGLMQVLQANVTDQWSLLLKPQLLSALQTVAGSGSGGAASLASQFLPMVQSWNGSFQTDEIVPTVYTYWIDEVQNATYDPMMEAAGLGAGAPDPFPNAFAWIATNDPNSPWFPGGWNKVSTDALTAALDLLSQEFHGQGISTWTWGTVHPFTMPSLTGEAQFAVGPFPWWGDGYTVSVAPTTRSPTFPLTQVSISSSLRMVVEPNPNATNGGTAWGIIPGGASENPVSPYYANLLEMWLDHTYVDMTLSATSAGPFPQQVVSTWSLQP